MKKKIVIYSIYILPLFVLHVGQLRAQSEFKILNKDKNLIPLSKALYGSFYELGFGRSDLLWSEKLFNRDFEFIRPLGEANSWLTYSRQTKEAEDWWHSGYEEPKWFIVKDGKKSNELPVKSDNYWPTAHGKKYIEVNNIKGTNPQYVGQNRIYLDGSADYTFSGLFSTTDYFNVDKNSHHPVNIQIKIFKNDNLDTCLLIRA